MKEICEKWKTRNPLGVEPRQLEHAWNVYLATGQRAVKWYSKLKILGLCRFLSNKDYSSELLRGLIVIPASWFLLWLFIFIIIVYKEVIAINGTSEKMEEHTTVIWLRENYTSSNYISTALIPNENECLIAKEDRLSNVRDNNQFMFLPNHWAIKNPFYSRNYQSILQFIAIILNGATKQEVHFSFTRNLLPPIRSACSHKNLGDRNWHSKYKGFPLEDTFPVWL